MGSGIVEKEVQAEAEKHLKRGDVIRGYWFDEQAKTTLNGLGKINRINQKSYMIRLLEPVGRYPKGEEMKIYRVSCKSQWDGETNFFELPDEVYEDEANEDKKTIKIRKGKKKGGKKSKKKLKKTYKQYAYFFDEGELKRIIAVAVKIGLKGERVDDFMKIMYELKKQRKFSSLPSIEYDIFKGDNNITPLLEEMMGELGTTDKKIIHKTKRKQPKSFMDDVVPAELVRIDFESGLLGVE